MPNNKKNAFTLLNLKANLGGFTLIELLIVIAIIGLLITVTITNWVNTRNKAKDTTRLGEMQQMRRVIETYVDGNFYVPPASGGTTCYRSDDETWDTLSTLVGANLPVDIENVSDYRYAFYRSDEAATGCNPSPHCGWLLTKSQLDNRIIILPIFKGDYTTANAVATWMSACGGGAYSGFEELK